MKLTFIRLCELVASICICWHSRYSGWCTVHMWASNRENRRYILSWKCRDPCHYLVVLRLPLNRLSAARPERNTHTQLNRRHKVWIHILIAASATFYILNAISDLNLSMKKKVISKINVLLSNDALHWNAKQCWNIIRHNRYNSSIIWLSFSFRKYTLSGWILSVNVIWAILTENKLIIWYNVKETELC